METPQTKDQTQSNEFPKGTPGESDQKSSIWFRIHLAYYVLTLALFAFILIMAWVAWNSDWIPNRGIGH